MFKTCLCTFHCFSWFLSLPDDHALHQAKTNLCAESPDYLKFKRGGDLKELVTLFWLLRVNDGEVEQELAAMKTSSGGVGPHWECSGELQELPGQTTFRQCLCQLQSTVCNSLAGAKRAERKQLVSFSSLSPVVLQP